MTNKELLLRIASKVPSFRRSLIANFYEEEEEKLDLTGKIVALKKYDYDYTDPFWFVVNHNSRDHLRLWGLVSGQEYFPVPLERVKILTPQEQQSGLQKSVQQIQLNLQKVKSQLQKLKKIKIK